MTDGQSEAAEQIDTAATIPDESDMIWPGPEEAPADRLSMAKHACDIELERCESAIARTHLAEARTVARILLDFAPPWRRSEMLKTYEWLVG